MTAALVLLGCSLLIWGRALLKRIDPEFPDELSWGAGLTLGLGILSSVMTALHFTRLVQPETVWAVYGLSLMFACAFFRRGLANLRIPSFHRVAVLPVFIFVGMSFVLLIGVLLPEVSYDALVYHLALPSLYKIRGGFTETVDHFYSAFPQTVEMLYLFALSIGDESTAKVFQPIFTLAIVLLIIGSGKLMGRSMDASLIPAIAFLSIPLTAFNLWNCYADLGTTLFALAGLFCFCSASTSRRAALAGLFCGWAMGTKFTAFPMIVLIPMSMWICQREKLLFKRTAIFAVAALATVSPWLIRNSVTFHNPFHPFFSALSTIQIHDPGFTKFLADANAHHPAEWISTPGRFAAEISQPVEWLLRPIGFSDDPGPILLFSLFCLFFLLIKDRSAVWSHPISACSAIFSVLGVTLWIFTGGLPRFFLPFLPPLLIAAISPDASARTHTVRRMLMFGVALISFLFVLGGLTVMEGRAVLFGHMNKDTFLSAERSLYPHPPYTAFQYLNARENPEDAVLLAGESRGYYLNRPFIAGSVHDVQPLVRRAKRAGDGDGLYRSMRNEGIRYILVNSAEIRRTRGYDLFPWDENSILTVKDFWAAHTRPLFRDFSPERGTDVSVFEIVERPENSEPPPESLYLTP